MCKGSCGRIHRGQQNIHYELIYAAEDSKRSIFKGYPKEGKIAAELCENCGRITLRAAPID
jgi:uncharacterized OB-fold protein